MKKYAETKEYIVTLHNAENLSAFYNDMESAGRLEGSVVPERSTDCVDRRPASRSTSYMLTSWEAMELRQDPRVKNVELHPRYLGVKPGLTATQTQTSSNWNKSGSTSNSMLNFALLRCTEETTRSNWGSNGTANQTATVTLTSTGKNVDFIAVDGDGIRIGHPEHAVNADGSGGSRFIQYNWYQHDPAVKGSAASNYTYTSAGDDHATHVAGTVAGNTQGWAREANIYSIYYFAGANNDLTFPYVMDYVRQFHATKQVNLETGRKNPTITNNSWGMSIFPSEWALSDITAVTYRGTRYTPNVGEITYTGYSGVCSSNTNLGNLLGLENFGNRITTTGPYVPPDGYILTYPPSWTLSGQQAYLTSFNEPAASYEVTLDGPCDVDLIHEVAMDAISGVMTIDVEILVKNSSDVTVFSYTDSDTTENGGTILASIRQTGLALNGDETYTIVYNTTVTSSLENITYASALSCTVTNDGTQGDAIITEITNQLLGAGSLTASTTPTSGNSDDGFWTLNLPFSVSYLGNTYSTIYIGTNFYLTFSAGSSLYSNLNQTTPNLPKIMWCAADNSVQRIYYGVEGADTETYTVTNSGSSAYTINSSSNPTLTLERGGTYTFNVSASGHPFWIKTAQVTGTNSAYNTGVTNNGTESGTITFTVPNDAPSTLYYICQFHGSMTGTINVVAGTRTYRVRIEGNGGISGTLGSPNMLCEYVFYEATPAQIDLQLAQTNRKNTGGGFTTGQLNAWGFISGQRIPKRVSALDADVEDAIDEGIIYVGAAGNGLWKHDVPGGLDWNNTFEMANRYPDSVTEPYYYMRGSSPTANDNLIDGDFDIPNICVGATDVTVLDQKSSYSDCGPGVDIWAPGTSIISALSSTGVSDARNGSYLLGKYSGTSMASPQVCGVLTCALEQNPHWNQEQAKSYILGIAKSDQLTGTNGGPADIRDLQGAPNLFLYYRKERPETGLSIPRNNQNARPATGQVWPRPKIYRFG